MEKNKEINDLLNINNLKIVQNKDYFKFSLDSVLLPSFVNINKNTHNILDLCTGNAPIPLILSTKTKANIIGVEIQKEIYDLANESVNLNGKSSQISLINDDVKNVYSMFESDSFDIITCNPPYFKYNENNIINKNNVKSIARHEMSVKLEDIVKISKKLLKNNGQLYFVHRAERLIDIFCLMRDNNIEPKRVRFVYPKSGCTSNLILVCGFKNGKPGLELMPPLIIHNDNGTYTDEVINMFS